MKKHPKTLVLILAGGTGGRLETLTDQRPKPALPVCGTHRLIDFSLSNCVNSGLADVWVVEQYQPHHLNDHLANGRPWDLDRTLGGLQVLPPYTGREGEGFAEGNADALHRNRRLLQETGCDLLLVLSADHLYQLDFRDVIEAHLAAGADLTVVTTRVARAEASRFAVVQSRDGWVHEFAYKPEEPAGDTVCAEVFLYTAAPLFEILDQLAEQHGRLNDYGDELLPFYVERRRVLEFALPGYWRDLGTVPAYYGAHVDILDGKFCLSPEGWSFRSRVSHHPPARVDGQLHDCLLAAGCHVAGSVSRSVVAPLACVEAGARVEGTVLLHGARVAAGAQVRCAVIDEDAVVEGGAELLGTPAEPVLVARGARVPADARLGPGGRWPAG